MGKGKGKVQTYVVPINSGTRLLDILAQSQIHKLKSYFIKYLIK